MKILLDGKAVASKIKEDVKNEIDKLSYTPKLVVVQIGDNKASSIYVNNKIKSCKEVGISSEVIRFSENIQEDTLLTFIEDLNRNKEVNGILVQLPLPKTINEKNILDKIDPLKDVDGFHYINSGKLFNGFDSLIPCTPAGIVEILKHYNIEIEGKHCVIVGRSNIVGKPISLLMLKENATITVCHSKTENLEYYTKMADILIVAVGKPKMIDSNYIKDGAIIIDVGIHRTENGMCGDVDFEDVKDKAHAITPVPGGVGPMTVAMLLKNTVKAAKLQRN